MTGSTISHYYVLEKLGEGGMGVIYKAVDERLNRPVALKLLPRDKAPDPEHRRRFAQEARAISALNHPNIVTIHDIASENDADFIVMEYVPGQTLDRCIPPRGMRLPDALRAAVQIAGALAAAHGAGVVHRDVKPGNVMITPDGLVKVLDFGLAKLGENSMTPLAGRITERGAIMGTASYMSPEQVEGRPVDARSDIFSFGSVLYEMVTGRRAFEGDSKIPVMSAILNADPRSINEAVSGVPHELDRIVARCLRKDPAERWQTMADVRIALEELHAELETEGARKLRRLPLRIVAIGAAGLLVFLAVLFAVRQRSDPPERIVPLTTAPGTEWQPTFSPDGNQLAYAAFGAAGPTDSHIYVMYIGGGVPLRLTNPSAPELDLSPAWSPDGRWLAFARIHPKTGRSALQLISPLGGPERTVTDIATGGAAVVLGAESIAWTPDSKWLAVADQTGSNQPRAIFFINIDTGERRQITKPVPPAVGDANPAVSPDGRSLVFTRNLTDVSGELFLLPLSLALQPDGEPRQLTHENLYAFSPAFLADSNTVVFSAGHLGISSVYRLELPGFLRGTSKPQRLASGSDGITSAVAPHVKGARSRLAFSKLQMDANIWLVQLGAGKAGEHQQHPLIATTRHEYNATISPDGRRLAFESNRGGSPEIWVSDIDGTNAFALTSFKGSHSGTPRWSPDGRYIAFDSVVSGQANIYVVPSGGGTPRQVTFDRSPDVVPAWSRDGKWIYYSSNRSGTWQIWKVAADNTAPEKPLLVTSNGGFGALESTDGKHIFYARERIGTSLWRMPVEGGPETRVIVGLDDPLNYDVTSEGIYYTARTTPPEAWVRFRSFSGADVPVARSDNGCFIGLSVSPDGRSLLYSRLEKTGGDIYMVDNFR